MNTRLTKEQFKKIRLSLGETQPEFAARLGYKSYRSVSYKEAGTRGISLQDEVILKPFIKKSDKAA